MSLCESKCIDNAKPIDAILFRKVLVGVDKLKECLVTTPSLRCLLLGVIKSWLSLHIPNVTAQVIFRACLIKFEPWINGFETSKQKTKDKERLDMYDIGLLLHTSRMRWHVNRIKQNGFPEHSGIRCLGRREQAGQQKRGTELLGLT